MNKPLSSNLLAPFEAIVNRCIAQDMKLAEGLAEHNGKLLQLDITAPAISVTVHIFNSSVSLSFTSNQSNGAPDPHDDNQRIAADGKISGSAVAMMHLLTERSGNRSLVNPDIQISGDSEFVQSVYRLFLDMEIDWLEPLSQLIGDIPTQGLDNLLNNLREFTLGTMNSLKRNVDEYLHEEGHMVPPLNQVEIFDQELDSLRLRLDRLQARIGRVADQLPDNDEPLAK